MRTYRAGDTVEDYCRVCKIERQHAVIVTDAHGRPIRVQCSFCRSPHNFRGGESDVPPASVPAPAHEYRIPRPAWKEKRSPVLYSADRERSAPVHAAAPSEPVEPAGPAESSHPAPSVPGPAWARPHVPPQPSSSPAVTAAAARSVDEEGMEALLRRIIREEAGLTPVIPAEKWRGGMLLLKPGKPGLQEKIWPIDVLFHKVVMIRNRLRTLEQQVNGMELPADVKLRLQAYISGCYGSLTSFNVLFADEEDKFEGTGGD